MQHNRAFLPLPDSKSGRALLRQYQELTHDIWLILLLLAVGYLINRIYVSRQREAYKSDRTFPHPVKSCLRFFRNNPITTVLLIAYIVAMISGTTYLYKDMFGWYPDLSERIFSRQLLCARQLHFRDDASYGLSLLSPRSPGSSHSELVQHSYQNLDALQRSGAHRHHSFER
jgi:hypothetical protein